MELGWVPRAQNYQADDLTSEAFDEFSACNRVKVDFEKLPIVGKLMEEAGRRDKELKLLRASKEAKSSSFKAGNKQLPTRKAKKGEMRWKDHW